MAKDKKDISVLIEGQLPEFVVAEHPKFKKFIEKYYEFMESAELTLTGIGASDQLLMEEGTLNYIQLQNEDQPTGRQENRIILEDSGVAVFQNGETITGTNSKATATIRVEDINANSRLFISSSNAFLIGEKITGSISGATALIDTGSRMDELIFQEFKGTGNMELILDRKLSERRLYPAIDIPKSGTRKEEKLFPEIHLDAIRKLRRTMVDLDPVNAMETLIGALKKHPTNAELLSKLKT